MAKAQEQEASQLAEFLVTQAETTRTTDQRHHEETPEETGTNNIGQTEASPLVAVTTTEVTEDQLPPVPMPDTDNNPQNHPPLQIDGQEEVPMLCLHLYAVGYPDRTQGESDDADSAASSSTSLAHARTSNILLWLALDSVKVCINDYDSFLLLFIVRLWKAE